MNKPKKQDIEQLLLRKLTFSPNQGIEGIDQAAEDIHRYLLEALHSNRNDALPEERATKYHFVTYDENEAKRYLISSKMLFALYDIREIIRGVFKYRIGEAPPEELLEKVLDEISNTINEAVNLEELFN